MLDNAFDALKKFDWGSDLAALSPIEDTAIAAHEKPELRTDLEQRCITALGGELSLDAQEYVCRKLAMIGSAAAVPVLATLRVMSDISHMARFALEQIPGAEASQALRDALPKVEGNTKIGVISSLGARRDAGSVTQLANDLKDSNPAISKAASLALGAIGSADAARALQAALGSSGTASGTIIDGILSCAESLLASNKVAEARDIYRRFSDDGQPRLVRLAATRGLLACSSRQS